MQHYCVLHERGRSASAQGLGYTKCLLPAGPERERGREREGGGEGREIEGGGGGRERENFITQGQRFRHMSAFLQSCP